MRTISVRQVRLTRQTGFTLAELMVTVGIMVMLLVITVPAFTAAIRSYRASTGVNVVQAALGAARSLAVRRHAIVSSEFRIAPGERHYMVCEEESGVDPDVPRGQRRYLPKDVTFVTSGTYEDSNGNDVSWNLQDGWLGDDDTWEDLDESVRQQTLDIYVADKWPAENETGARDETDGGSYDELGDIAFRADGSSADQRGTTTVIIEDATDEEDIRYWKICVIVPSGQIEIEPLKEK